MHEISNDGAREQFESLLATVIVPAMIKCARVRINVCDLKYQFKNHLILERREGVSLSSVTRRRYY